MNEKKTCKICNKQIEENSFASDSKKQHYFHITCQTKLDLLSKIRKSNALNSVDFKCLEIIFGLLIDELSNEIIPSSNQCRSEKQPKFEITLDPDKKLQIDIISKAFNLDHEVFIKLAIEHEVEFIRKIFGYNNVKDDLETYYHFEINIDELKKLILIEEVL